MNGRKIELVYGLVVYAPAGSGMFVVNTGSGMLQLGRMTVEAIRKSEQSAGKAPYIQERFGYGFPEPVRLKSPYPVMQLFKELHSLYGNGQPHDVFRRQLLFYRILDMLLADMPDNGGRETGGAGIEQTIDFIHKHYRDALTRDQLAGQSGVSPAHFSRLFRKETGMSFSDYVLHLRIEKAKELLLLSNSGVADIARQVGFENAHYFSRKFKQMAGISPSAYIHQPKTYVSLDAGMTACLLTLGVVPRVCVLPAWMREHFGHLLDEAECITIDGLEEQNIRLLRELKPDLVFCNVHKIDMGPVAQLGPVAAIDLEAMDWKELICYIAEVVGKQQEAEAWLTSFEKRLALAKQQLGRVLHKRETFAILQMASGNMHIYGDLRSMGGPMLYRCLQLPPPAAVKERIIDQGLLNVRISAAELPEYSADHLIIINYASNWVDRDKTVASHPQWKKFAAVRNNQVYEVNRELFYGFDPLSLELQMREIVKLLTSRLPSHS
jgi:ABC-type Fe3+-hydroxamate transport system substrate-binding protein